MDEFSLKAAAEGLGPPVSRRETALLLDIDGTLLDFAPTPREVWVSPELLRTLRSLHVALGGAVAFVSGRAVSDIDLIFSPLLLPAVGGHGAEFRPDISHTEASAPPPLPAAVKREFAIVSKIARGILVEDKGYAIALHYRLAPDRGGDVIAAVDKIRDTLPPGSIDVMHGKFVVEITPAGVTKATGVHALMALAPFAGRKPIFVGDDTTDETVFPVIPHYEGRCFSVGRRLANTNGHFEHPHAVRRWLAHAATEFEKTEEFLP
jgi:trehalose 6-phosphate phosphatase